MIPTFIQDLNNYKYNTLFTGVSGSFDVYNIETALPKLDLDAIENHLKAAKEAERRVSAENLSLNKNK